MFGKHRMRERLERQRHGLRGCEIRSTERYSRAQGGRRRSDEEMQQSAARAEEIREEVRQLWRKRRRPLQRALLREAEDVARETDAIVQRLGDVQKRWNRVQAAFQFLEEVTGQRLDPMPFPLVLDLDHVRRAVGANNYLREGMDEDDWWAYVRPSLWIHPVGPVPRDSNWIP